MAVRRQLVRDQKRQRPRRPNLQLSAVVAVVASPARRLILMAIGKHGPMSVTALARKLRLSPPQVRRHLLYMQKTRVIRSDHRHRPATFGLDLGARVMFVGTAAVLAFDLAEEKKLMLQIPHAQTLAQVVE